MPAKNLRLTELRLKTIFLLLASIVCLGAGATVVPGAERTEQYLPLLQGKRVALVINHTSVIGGRLLPDTLLDRSVKLVRIFAPEHGFRGTEDAGAHIKNETDPATGLPVASLHGKRKKPAAADLSDVDVVIYDIQDVGVRFYTYISTLQYVMEACAENGVRLIVLDRPNPNGFYVDGPVLDTAHRSFVGMQPIPVVYGMTPGEYARMLQGEQWFAGADRLDMKIIPCLGYDHHTRYPLPVAPSPNLKSDASVFFYPSLCLFEGTHISMGRGTPYPFEQWGHPALKGKSSYSFVPVSMPGAGKPPHEGKTCYGVRMTDTAPPEHYFSLSPLLTAYQWFPDKENFFIRNNFFEKLAGTSRLREQVKQGLSEAEIRATWQKDLLAFKKIRKQYLLYADFE